MIKWQLIETEAVWECLLGDVLEERLVSLRKFEVKLRLRATERKKESEGCEVRTRRGWVQMRSMHGTQRKASRKWNRGKERLQLPPFNVDRGCTRETQDAQK